MNGQKKVQLVWFRNDFRVEDNSALSFALDKVDEKGPVVGVYIATPLQWQVHNDASLKIDFWKRNLQLLEISLNKLSVSLYCFEVPDYKSLPLLFEKLQTAWQFSSVLVNKEYPLNEVNRDLAVKRILKTKGCEFFAFDDRLLVSLDKVLTKSGEPYRVFTPFARQAKLGIESSEPLIALSQNYQFSLEKGNLQLK